MNLGRNMALVLFSMVPLIACGGVFRVQIEKDTSDKQRGEKPGQAFQPKTSTGSDQVKGALSAESSPSGCTMTTAETYPTKTSGSCMIAEGSNGSYEIKLNDVPEVSSLAVLIDGKALPSDALSFDPKKSILGVKSPLVKAGAKLSISYQGQAKTSPASSEVVGPLTTCEDARQAFRALLAEFGTLDKKCSVDADCTQITMPLYDGCTPDVFTSKATQLKKEAQVESVSRDLLRLCPAPTATCNQFINLRPRCSPVTLECAGGR